MQIRSCTLVGIVTLAMSAAPLWARPSFSGDCTFCHTPATGPPQLAVTNHSGFADPDESGTGAPDRGLLKYFSVLPGTTATLAMDVLDGAASFAVEIKGFENTGVVAGGVLGYSTSDAAWTALTGDTIPGPLYYAQPADGGMAWSGLTESFTFDIDVDALTPADFYELTFAVAGKSAEGDRWYDEELFYLNVLPEPSTLILLAAGALCLRLRRTSY